MPVIVRAAAAGGDAIDDPIKFARQPGQRLRSGDVAEERLDAGGLQFIFRRRTPAQAGNLVAQPDQFRAERQADITAADNQAFHL